MRRALSLLLLILWSISANAVNSWAVNHRWIIHKNSTPWTFDINGFNCHQNSSLLVSPAQNGINTGNPSTSAFCAGTTVNVPFSVTGTFNAGNVFTAELSDAGGSFTAPVNIGTVAGISSGSINATIPANAPAGNAYRVRVVANNPNTIGTSNSANLTILTAPFVWVSPSSISICEGGATILTANGASSYSWSASGTNISTNNPVMVSPVTTNTYTVIGVSGGNSCFSTAYVTVTVVNSTNAQAGPDMINLCYPQINLYATPVTGSATGVWSISSGSGGSFTDPTQANTLFNGLSGESYTLRWTVNQLPCLPNTDEVFVSFQPAVAATFTYQVSGCCTVGITNTSTAGNYYSYDFGDNSPADTAQNPTHHYAAPGTYTITQTVTNANGCTATSSQTVSIITGASDALASQVKLFPNPASGQFTIDLSGVNGAEGARLEMYNVLGQPVMSRGLAAGGAIAIPVKHLAEGLYLLRIQLEDQVVTKQLHILQ